MRAADNDRDALLLGNPRAFLDMRIIVGVRAEADHITPPDELFQRAGIDFTVNNRDLCVRKCLPQPRADCQDAHGIIDPAGGACPIIICRADERYFHVLSLSPGAFSSRLNVMVFTISGWM